MFEPIYAGVRTFVRRKSLFTLLSFMIPFLAMLAVFIVQQVHPFGMKMILTVDLYHQYAPFAVEVRNKILSGDSFFYSWNIGLGSNFLATFANYAASPLNLILLIFPTKFVADGIALIVCIRAGLAGLFMSMLLRDMDHNRKDFFLSAFSSMYALCGWVLSYFWNIMWMDAVVLLPLIVLGMRKLMRDGKPMLYTISLFFCLWSNFFTGYFVCVFLVLFAPVCYVTAVEKKTVPNFFFSAGRFSLYSLIGGGMAGILLIPTYIALGHASATGDAFPKDYNLTHDMFDFFARLFLGSNPNIRDGMANVYSGVLILLLVLLFFLNTRIALKEKISYGVLLLIMYFSFASRILNFIWHGFHFPNQIPYRQAFLMSFLLILVGYRALRNLKSVSNTDLTISIFIVLSYIVLYEKLGGDSEGYQAIALTAMYIIVYAVILRITVRSGRSAVWLRNLLFGAIIAELIVASQLTVGLVAMNEGFTGWNFYGKKEPEVRAFLDRKAADPEVGPFVRAEVYPAYICNEPALYDMKGLSIFSSTARESQVKLMKNLGFHSNKINSFRNYGMTEVTASLFGIRYMVDLEASTEIPSVFDQAEENEQGLRIFRNPDALPLGYMVSSDILDMEVVPTTNVFVATNDFLNALGADSVYVPDSIVTGELENAEYLSGNSFSGYIFDMDLDAQSASIELLFNKDSVGKRVYLFETSGQSCSVQITGRDPDGESSETQIRNLSARSDRIIDVGVISDSLVSAKLTWSGKKTKSITIFCYTVDEDAYSGMIDRFGSSGMEITSFDTTRVQGRIDVREPGIMMMTMTYDEGWKAWVDGEPAEILNLAGAFCGIALESGSHEILLKYVPEGLNYGLASSLASVFLLIALTCLHSFLRKRRTEKSAKAICKAEEFPEISEHRSAGEPVSEPGGPEQ
ncbi:MAG: YfhO family protein [Clostridiaceae bacterium]|nr:YfhO family protein [Clostridiaceae bacterium]